MVLQNNSSQYQEIQIQKVNDEPAEMVYRNNDKVVYRKLHEDEYHEIFEHFKPRVNYSIPDRLIQDFDKRNQFLPLYKESNNYSLEDLKESVRRGNELQYIEKILSQANNVLKKSGKKNKKKRQNRRKIPSRTMKKRQMTPRRALRKKIEKKINKKSTKTKKNHVKKTSK